MMLDLVFEISLAPWVFSSNWTFLRCQVNGNAGKDLHSLKFNELIPKMTPQFDAGDTFPKGHHFGYFFFFFGGGGGVAIGEERSKNIYNFTYLPANGGSGALAVNFRLNRCLFTNVSKLQQDEICSFDHLIFVRSHGVIYPPVPPNSSPLKRAHFKRKESCLPTIHFQGQTGTVSGRVIQEYYKLEN